MSDWFTGNAWLGGCTPRVTLNRVADGAATVAAVRMARVPLRAGKSVRAISRESAARHLSMVPFGGYVFECGHHA